MAEDGDLIPAINRLVDDIDKAEAETAEMKRTVNRLCGYANLPIRYPTIEDAQAGGRLRISPGQFYRKPLATAVSAYLKMRGNADDGGTGPATIDEIYDALREGGFIFNAESDATGKRSLAIAIAKNSQTFEKLPTGQFGMRSWYQRKDEEE
ncbi:MAG: hypothetical protein AB1342_10885 [Pseudomonadota bacterium]